MQFGGRGAVGVEPVDGGGSDRPGRGGHLLRPLQRGAAVGRRRQRPHEEGAGHLPLLRADRTVGEPVQARLRRPARLHQQLPHSPLSRSVTHSKFFFYFIHSLVDLLTIIIIIITVSYNLFFYHYFIHSLINHYFINLFYFIIELIHYFFIILFINYYFIILLIHYYFIILLIYLLLFFLFY